MPEAKLDAADAAELAEMLQFISEWLARDPARLGASLEEFVGQPSLRRTGLVSLLSAQGVKPLQCLGHALDPDPAVVHPGTPLFRRS